MAFVWEPSDLYLIHPILDAEACIYTTEHRVHLHSLLHHSSKDVVRLYCQDPVHYSPGENRDALTQEEM